MWTNPRDISRDTGYAEATIRRWINSGDLPCIRPRGRGPGRPILVSEADVEALMATRHAAGLAGPARRIA
jgi:predicted site-specific integrase-resolvase